MVDTLTEVAIEGSTYVATCTFADEDGNAVTPQSTVAWRLLTSDGTEVSSGTESAAASVVIVLGSTDLVVSGGNRGDAYLTLVVSTTYNSAAGSGLDFVDAVRFPITNILDTP